MAQIASISLDLQVLDDWLYLVHQGPMQSIVLPWQHAIVTPEARLKSILSLSYAKKLTVTDLDSVCSFQASTEPAMLFNVNSRPVCIYVHCSTLNQVLGHDSLDPIVNFISLGSSLDSKQ